ncbi:MAG TPA: methyltransferase domain-containing protein [Vicinamibacterales bacterium]
MRYSLLSYVCCPACRGVLGCFVVKELPTSISQFVAEQAPRAMRAPSDGAAAFAPMPRFTPRTPIGTRLHDLQNPAAPFRNREAVVESGLLVCADCARWFPIISTLPELLPDHLRNTARESQVFEELAAMLPADFRALLRRPDSTVNSEDAGAHYKRAEIGVASKVDDPNCFFGPGYSAPFNPGNTEFTVYLISLFGNVVRMLGIDGKSSQTAVVVDSGCGYAWTTEWLSRSGLEAIGLDITRTYLEIAIQRIGESRPHLLVADVENLPIVDGCADAVLAFESFHHLPCRPAAMAGYARALKDGGITVLAEPGGAHEDAAVSKDTMQKFGILEKGMELEDVSDYIAGAPFAPPEEDYVLHVAAGDLQKGITEDSAWRHSQFHGHIFRIRKDASAVAPDRTHRARETVSAHVRSRIDTTRQLDAELQRTTAELGAVKIELRNARLEVADAARKIDAMQRSAFWRARDAWVWVASLFGSDRGRVQPPGQGDAQE